MPADNNCQFCDAKGETHDGYCFACTIKRLNDLNECCARYSAKLMAIDTLIRDQVQEVKNAVGGVVGYRLDLTCNESQTLWNLAQLTP